VTARRRGNCSHAKARKEGKTSVSREDANERSGKALSLSSSPFAVFAASRKEPVSLAEIVEIDSVRDPIDLVDDAIDIVRDTIDVVRDEIDIIRDTIDVVRDEIDIIHDTIDIVRDEIDVIHDTIDVIRDPFDIVRDEIDIMHDTIDVIRDPFDRVGDTKLSRAHSALYPDLANAAR
jgi:hypothetical protein